MNSKQVAPTFQERAYSYVKSQITNLGFKPGEYLTDVQIANKLYISRTPVREAFRMLEKEGLLIYEPRRGWKVYTLSLEDINEIFEIKIALEQVQARKAAQCKDEILCRKLKEIIELMHKAADENDVGSWTMRDADLHHIIFLMANNQRALQIIENINDQWKRVRIGFSARTGRIKRSIVEHEAIVDAILEGNEDEAEKTVGEHLKNLREELISLLINMVYPFAKNGV